MSARKDYPYPQDEFDVAGAAGGPEGVHRAERSTARKLAPWIVVLLIVPLFSFLLIFYLSQNDSDFGENLFNEDQPKPTAPVNDGEGENGAAENANDADGEGQDGAAPDDEDATPDDGDAADEDEAEPEDPPAPPVNRQASVRVLNATSISGLAAVGAERVQADGFSAVVADNYRGGGNRTASVVKYTQEDLKPTAEQIAQVLGISDVVEDPEPGDGIVVELWTGLN